MTDTQKLIIRKLSEGLTQQEISKYLKLIAHTPSSESAIEKELIKLRKKYKVKTTFQLLFNKSFKKHVGQEAAITEAYMRELKKIENLGQTQVSLTDQLTILNQFSNKLGLYDASDFLKSTIKNATNRS